jgi:hypothetical protein
VANTRFEADKLSLFEMVNQYLPDKYKLKTYRIFPCRTEPIQDAYGFLEYLPHNPWPEIDYVKEMGRLYQEFSVTMPGKINWLAIREELKADYADYLLPQDAAGIDGVGAFSSYFTTKFELELKKLYLDLRARNKASDFVVETDEEVECYSYQCGIITAIARIFGISDIHVQNFIISGKLPCLIDTEVSFRPDLFSIRNIGCLWGTGAMRKDAIYPHLPGRVLYDSSGLLAELSGIREIEKNRLYRLYRLSDDNSLIACGPTREKFVGGFNRALDIIKEHADEFFSWIHSDVVRNTWVRVVPCDTEELGVMVQYYWLGDVDVFWRLHENDILQRTIIKITDSDKTFFIPNFLALRKKWIERDLSRCSIPIFYIRVKDITPVDSRGRRVLVDYSDIRKRLQSGLKGGSHGAILSALSFENPERYYKKSGEEKIHENITQLTQDPNFTQELQSELIENLTFDLDYTSVTEPPRVGDEVMVATSDDVEKIKCCSSCVCQ